MANFEGGAKRLGGVGKNEKSRANDDGESTPARRVVSTISIGPDSPVVVVFGCIEEADVELAPASPAWMRRWSFERGFLGFSELMVEVVVRRLE